MELCLWLKCQRPLLSVSGSKAFNCARRGHSTRIPVLAVCGISPPLERSEAVSHHCPLQTWSGLRRSVWLTVPIAIYTLLNMLSLSLSSLLFPVVSHQSSCLQLAQVPLNTWSQPRGNIKQSGCEATWIPPVVFAPKSSSLFLLLYLQNISHSRMADAVC